MPPLTHSKSPTKQQFGFAVIQSDTHWAWLWRAGGQPSR
jgi:hypothetical protein